MKWYALVDEDNRIQTEPVDFKWPDWQEVPGPLPENGWATTSEFRIQDGEIVHDPTQEMAEIAKHVNNVESYETNSYMISCETDAALCDTYENLLQTEATIAEQDAAICELYEMIA